MASSHTRTRSATLAGRRARSRHVRTRTRSAALPPRVTAWTPLSGSHPDLRPPSTSPHPRPCRRTFGAQTPRWATGGAHGGQPRIRREPNGQEPPPPGLLRWRFCGVLRCLASPSSPRPPRSGAALLEERRQRRLTGPRLVHPTLGADRRPVERGLCSFPSVSHHVDSQGGLMSTSPQKQWVWSLRQPCSQVLDPGMRLEWGLVQSSADS